MDAAASREPQRPDAGSRSSERLVESPADSLPYPASSKAWWAVGIFFLASVLLALDRGILTLVVDPVRRDLNISEVQISLLQGLSFSILYATAGIPLGLMVDKLPRRWVLAGGLFTWTLATALGGFTHNFTELFVTRIFVGLGEATLGPCAMSLIADLFAPAKRGRPLGVYIMGQSLAGGLSIMFTSWVIGAVPAGRLDFLGLGAAAPWRAVFILSGSLGFIVLALLFTFREPGRRGAIILGKAELGLGKKVRYLVRNRGVFIPFYIGFAVWSAVNYGLAAWNATFLFRRFHLHPQDIGAWLGGATALVGIAGPTLAGFLVDRITKAGSRSGKFMALTFLPLPPLVAALAPFAPNVELAVMLGLIVTITAPMVGVVTLAVAQETMPSNMRGLSVSLFSVCNTLIGATGGPLLIALATEHIFKDPRMVGYSISLLVVPACLSASLIFLVGWLNLRRALRRSGDLVGVMDIQDG